VNYFWFLSQEDSFSCFATISLKISSRFPIDQEGEEAMINKELLVNTFKPDGQIKSSSRKRRQNCSKTVVRPDTLLSYLFICKPHGVFMISKYGCSC